MRAAIQEIAILESIKENILTASPALSLGIDGAAVGELMIQLYCCTYRYALIIIDVARRKVLMLLLSKKEIVIDIERIEMDCRRILIG